MYLSELKKGETAVIEAIEADDLLAKLFEMGCVPGEKVKMVLIAPFGDPVAIQVAGYTLAMRIQEAAKVRIRKDSFSSQNIKL